MTTLGIRSAVWYRWSSAGSGGDRPIDNTEPGKQLESAPQLRHRSTEIEVSTPIGYSKGVNSGPCNLAPSSRATRKSP